MDVLVRWLEILFGKGDSGYPFWLLTVRVNALLFVFCAGMVISWHLRRARVGRALGDKAEIGIVLVLTALAGVLRFLVVEHNVTALGGIGYSRILLGYRGHFGTAQLYSLVYAHTVRDLEHAVFLNRVAATLTVPLVYLLCRRLAPAMRSFGLIAAVLVALHPLHLLFTATDGLPASSSLLAVASYLLLESCVGDEERPGWMRMFSGAGAASGLALVTQVRYENAIFLVPAFVYLFARRRTLAVSVLVPGVVLFLVFISVYAVEAVGSGPSYRGDVPLADGLRAAVRELLDNPIYAIGPVLVGSAAAALDRRSAVRWLAPLPLLLLAPLIVLAIALERHDYSAGFVALARIYVNQVVLLSLVGGYGLALLWESPWRVGRAVAGACLLWVGVLPVLFWPNLRERYLEMAEHDFFRAALTSLPPGIERVVVPDDEVLLRESQSTIELTNKYRMIAHAAAPGIELVEVTRFVEHPGEFDCGRDNCLFFRGLPCKGLTQYWFAEAACAQMMATHAGLPVREEDTEAGSFLDCSIYRGAERRRWCEPTRQRQRFGLYRVVN